MRCHGDIMLSLGNMQKSRASIAGSERCIILMSFIKLWVGTLQGLRACLLWVPTRQEDVLISRGPKVTLNLLHLDLKKKRKKFTWLHLFSCLFSCRLLCWVSLGGPSRATFTQVSIPAPEDTSASLLSVCCGTGKAQCCVSPIRGSVL